MIRPFADWRDLAWLIGWLLSWLLGWLNPAHGAGFADIAVRVENRLGAASIVGSGTLAAGDGQTALVITCQHLLREGTGQLTVERTNHERYAGRLLGISRYNDVAAIEIPDPGVRTLRIADRQAPAATMIGFGSTRQAWHERGRLVEQAGNTAFYSFTPEDGDSGGGVFDDSGALVGVVWGTTGDLGAVVPLADVRRALGGPACGRYWKQTSSTKVEPMFATPLILAAGMLAQSPGLPSKGTPLSVAPSAQGQTYSPQPQAADVPITIRLRVIPEVEAYAPRPQPQAPVSYGGGGCYGGSYSAGSYGVSSGFSTRFESAGTFGLSACPGGVCYAPGFAFAPRRRLAVKSKTVISDGPGGLRGLLGGR